MNFIRFPFLVQQEILQHFSITEKVIISLCSTKSAHVIRKLRLNPKKVQYIIDGDVSNKKVDKEEVTIWMVYLFSWIPEHRRMQLQIGGNTIRYVRSLTHSTDPSPRSHQKSLKYIEDRLISRIQDHINFIFPRSTNRQLITTDFYSPNYEKFENLHEISLGWVKYSAEELEMSLRKHPDLRGFQFGFDDDTFKIKEDSPILSIGKLDLFKSNPKTTETLLENFNGRCLCVNETEGDTKMFMDFVEKWMSGEGYENLKAVEVLAGRWNQFEMSNDLESFKRKVKAMEWDPERRPCLFEMKERLINHGQNSWDSVKTMFVNRLIDCGHFFDIQRNDGKKLASFFISRHEFKFLVWEDLERNQVEYSESDFESDFESDSESDSEDE